MKGIDWPDGLIQYLPWSATWYYDELCRSNRKTNTAGYKIECKVISHKMGNGEGKEESVGVNT